MTPETISQAIPTTESLKPPPFQILWPFYVLLLPHLVLSLWQMGWEEEKLFALSPFTLTSWLFAYPCLALKEWEMAQRWMADKNRSVPPTGRLIMEKSPCTPDAPVGEACFLIMLLNGLHCNCASFLQSFATHSHKHWVVYTWEILCAV